MVMNGAGVRPAGWCTRLRDEYRQEGALVESIVEDVEDPVFPLGLLHESVDRVINDSVRPGCFSPWPSGHSDPQLFGTEVCPTPCLALSCESLLDLEKDCVYLYLRCLVKDALEVLPQQVLPIVVVE